jgi:hypothetical protein
VEAEIWRSPRLRKQWWRPWRWVRRGKREKRPLAGGEATGGGGVGMRRAEGRTGRDSKKAPRPRRSLGFRARLSHACTTPRVSIALPRRRDRLRVARSLPRAHRRTRRPACQPGRLRTVVRISGSGAGWRVPVRDRKPIENRRNRSGFQ